MKHPIVGITGKARAGKDTIANELVVSQSYVRRGLADPLRMIVSEVFHPTMAQLFIDKEEPLANWPGWTVRKLLQYIGTEMFREHITPDIWVKSLIHYIEAQETRGSCSWVIPDVRFPNEAEQLRAAFGDRFSLLKVVRPGADGTVGLESHASEAFDIEAEYVIENTGTLENLAARVAEFHGRIIGKETEYVG
jgi:hypothetical protein